MSVVFNLALTLYEQPRIYWILVCYFSLYTNAECMCHMFSKHLNSCTCLKNLSIKSTKTFFQVKSSEYSLESMQCFKNVTKYQRNSVKMWAGFYWFSTGLISDLQWTSNEPSGPTRSKTLLEELKKNSFGYFMELICFSSALCYYMHNIITT
jgi:hypothetical protein